MKHHVGPGERLFVHPNVRIDERKIGCFDGNKREREWHSIPSVIYIAQANMVLALRPPRECDECRFCCSLVKTEWEPYLLRNGGCMWLDSQFGNDPMPDELRPDICGARLEAKKLKISVHGAPDSNMDQHLNSLRRLGYAVRRTSNGNASKPDDQLDAGSSASIRESY